MVSFSPGDLVVVKRLKREGTVIKVLSEDTFLIRLPNSLTVKCLLEDLTPSKSRTKRRKKPLRSKSARAEESVSSRELRRTIDLHGLTAQQAEERTILALNESLLAGVDVLEIIHGIGQGILCEVVHSTLSGTTHVRSFRLMPGNSGTTEAFL